MTALHSVSFGGEDVQDAETIQNGVTWGVSGIPHFEGQPVDYTRMKLAAVSKLETGASWHRIDDMVRMVVEGRIVNVTHVVDEASGKLMRVHTIKVADATEIPWDIELPSF